MKILHMHWRFDALGGGETYVGEVIGLLQQAGHQTHLMTGASMTDKGLLIEGCEHHLVPVSSGMRSGLRERRGILSQVSDIAPDVIHLHQTGGLISPLIEAELGRSAPILKTIHDVGLICPQGDEFIKQVGGQACEHRFDAGCVLRGCYRLDRKGPRPYLSALWQRRVTRRHDRLLVSTQYMRRELLRNEFSDERIAVLPLFTRMQGDGAAPAPSKSERLLFVGRLDRSKGGGEFIEALERLDPRASWHAEIVGDGPVREALMRRVAEMPIADRVHFRGHVPAARMPEMLAGARAVVMPSMIPESFGLVGIEAMACARPVVAFDSGGISDWLEDDSNGLLVRRGDRQGLADAMARLLADPALADRLGQRGLSDVSARYRPAAHLEGLLRNYDDIIDQRARSLTPRADGIVDR